MKMENVYRDVGDYSNGEIEAAIARDEEPVKLACMIISIALYHQDLHWSVQKCLTLANHRDPIVRGNAVLGFGHLARRFGKLDERAVKPIIERALVDKNEYVAGQAWAAASDVAHFLSWEVAGFAWGVDVDNAD